MTRYDTEIFLEGFKFTEGLRWHHNSVWFCDVWDNKVYRFDTKGNKIEELVIDNPAGLGWLSDGSLLITSLSQRKLLQYHKKTISIYIELEISAPGYCHDFTVSQEDIIYLSTSSFYPSYNAVPVKSNILMVTKDKKITIAADNIGYPNGIKITPNGKTLLVAETFAASVLSFDINKNGTLTDKRYWAKFDDLGFNVIFNENGIPKDINRHYPDGICFDDKLNAVWVASPGKKEVICVNQKGKILNTINTASYPFDCILGGEDERTLFVATTDMHGQYNTGKIEKINV